MSSQKILESTAQAFANSWEMMSCPKGSPSSCVSIETGDSHWESNSVVYSWYWYLKNYADNHMNTSDHLASSSYFSPCPSIRRNREVVWFGCVSRKPHSSLVTHLCHLLPYLLFLTLWQNNKARGGCRNYSAYSFPLLLWWCKWSWVFSDVHHSFSNTSSNTVLTATWHIRGSSFSLLKAFTNASLFIPIPTRRGHDVATIYINTNVDGTGQRPWTS